MNILKCRQCGLVNVASAKDCERCQSPLITQSKVSGLRIAVLSGISLIIFFGWAMWVSGGRPNPTFVECSAIAQKAEARASYEWIDKTDMGVFDSARYLDPHTMDSRLLHGYMTLDNYAKAHNVTLSKMTSMERRKVLLDDLIKSEGGGIPAELTPDERAVAGRCLNR